MNEFEKMRNGYIFNTTLDPLPEMFLKAHNLCTDYNHTYENDSARRREIISRLMPNCHESVFFQGPIFCDYGTNLYIGENTFVNYNFTALDSAIISVGSNVFIGPNVSLMTATHAMRWQERNQTKNSDGSINDREYAKSITIGDNCWLASNVTVIGGVTIGEGCVIGAGSVVTKDIPANCFAAGNPCRVIREITEKDSIDLKAETFKE